MMRAGTLPGRKPGTRIWAPIFLYAASRLGLISSNGTSMESLTRVGLKFSAVLFTLVLLLKRLAGSRSVRGVQGAPCGATAPRSQTMGAQSNRVYRAELPGTPSARTRHGPKPARGRRCRCALCRRDDLGHHAVALALRPLVGEAEPLV